MARTLGDVLHLFLGEERAPVVASQSASEARARRTDRRRLVTCIADGTETLAIAIAWNLAAAHAALGTRTTWISTNASVWAPAASAPPALQQVRAARAKDARAEAASAETDSVWLHLAPNPSVSEELLSHALFFVSSETDASARCLAHMEGLRARAPGGELSVLIHGVTSRAEGRSVFARLAEAASRRLGGSGLGGSVSEAGVLVDDLEVYRSLVSRRPVCLAAPDSRAALALFRAARRLSEAPDGGEGAAS